MKEKNVRKCDNLKKRRNGLITNAKWPTVRLKSKMFDIPLV